MANANELERLEKLYKDLLNMGFSAEDVQAYLNGSNKSPLKPLTQSEAIDVLVLYFRAKKLLSDKHVQEIMDRDTLMRGTSSVSKDSDALFNYAELVEAIENIAMIKNLKGKGSLIDWENYFSEKERDYKRYLQNTGKATRRQIDNYAEIKDDPYSPKLKAYLETYMSDDMKKEIAHGINTDPKALAVVRGFTLQNGKTKQESYSSILLKYLYADTSISRERTKRIELERQNKDLRKQINSRISTEQQFTELELALMGALGSSSADVKKVITDSAADIKNLIGKSSESLAQIVNQGFKDQNERLTNIEKNTQQSSLGKKVIHGVLYGALALSLLGNVLFGIKNADLQDQVDSFSSTAAYVDQENSDLITFENEFNRFAVQGFTAEEIQKLRDFYAQLAENDNIEKYGYSSTRTMALMVDKAELNSEVTSLTSQISGLNAQIAVLEKTASSIDGLNDKITELTTTVQSLNDKIDDLQAIIDADPDASSVQKLKEELDKAMDDLDLAQARIESLEAENADLKTQVTALNNTISELNYKLGTLEAGKTADAATIATLNETISTLNSKVASLETELQTNKELSEQEKAELQAELDTAKAELNAANSTISNLQAENTDLKTQIEALNNTISTLNSTISTLETGKATDAATIQALEESVDILENQVKALEEELATNGSLSSQEKAELLSQIADSKRALETANARIAQLEAENADLKTQISAFEATVSSLNAQIKELQDVNTADKATIASLNSTISSLEATKAQLEAQLDQALETNELTNAELVSVKKALSDAEVALETAKSQVKALSDKNAELTASNAELQNKVTALESEIKNLNETISGLNSSNTNLTSQLAAAVSNLESTTAKYNELVEKYNASEEKNEALESELATIKSELEVAYVQIDALMADKQYVDALYQSITGESTNGKTAEEIRKAISEAMGYNYESSTGPSIGDE